jgi:hypothetical protein
MYIVLNPERFFLHIYGIPSSALFEASASERNTLPIPHVARTHTHTFLPFLQTVRQASLYIPGCCNVTLYQEDWEVFSEQPDKNIDQIQRQHSKQYNIIDYYW